MGKNCPGKPESRLFNSEISFCRDSFFSYKRNFIFGEICVSDEIPANRGPRLAARTGTVFHINTPLKGFSQNSQKSFYKKNSEKLS